MVLYCGETLLRGIGTVKRTLMVLGVVALCVPMVFMAWLLAASRWTKMDASTVRMPMGVRQMVAQVVTQKAAWNDRPAFARAVKLDPNSALGWDGLCSDDGLEKDVKTELANCRKAVALSDNAGDENVIGRALEKLKDPCAAAEAYRKASVQAVGSWTFPERMGEAALDCGDLPTARAGLEAAVDKATKALSDKESDDDDKKDAKDRLTIDHEFLIVVYDRMKEPQLADAMCKIEHPDWKRCACDVDKDGNVACDEASR